VSDPNDSRNWELKSSLANSKMDECPSARYSGTVSAEVSYGDAVAAMRAVHPRLEQAWKDTVAEFDPEQPPPTVVFDEFASATVGLLRDSDPIAGRLFELIEHLLADGDSQVVGYVATGFVETLSNIWPPDVDPALWQGRMGPLALAHAQAWADFWGACQVATVEQDR
jgi:hypothetical protein